eukprot:276588-Amphidinium_carterae.1
MAIQKERVASSCSFNCLLSGTLHFSMHAFPCINRNCKYCSDDFISKWSFTLPCQGIWKHPLKNKLNTCCVDTCKELVGLRFIEPHFEHHLATSSALYWWSCGHQAATRQQVLLNACLLTLYLATYLCARKVLRLQALLETATSLNPVAVEKKAVSLLSSPHVLDALHPTVSCNRHPHQLYSPPTLQEVQDLDSVRG